MDAVTLVGLAAGALTTVSFAPQVIKTWKTKSAEDISTGMIATFCSGILLWVFYGFSVHSIPIILANIITFCLALVILILKMRYR
jgi:MtN3 and saliva related transmembrane protein